MRLLHWGKDGGAYSTVKGFWLVEIKLLFSIVLLKFEDGSREAYHSHAFNCFSWVLSGHLTEMHKDGGVQCHRPSWRPFGTYRDTFHKVVSVGDTWVLSFRGPWAKTWKEFLPCDGKEVTLTHGRKEVS